MAHVPVACRTTLTSQSTVPPAARLSARLPAFSITGPTKFRVQGWDPVLIISQIVSLQALHYLSLSLLLPPLLAMFASPTLLSYEGGPSSVSMIMDWREFLGVSTASTAAARGVAGGLVGLSAAKYVGGAVKASPGITAADLTMGLVRVVEADPLRGWVVALGWVLASLVDVLYLYHLVRRPTHILDFALTLIFNHLILTTYFTAHFPTSLFFWTVLTLSTVTQVVLAEQCCVARDMREGFSLSDPNATPALYANSPAPLYPPAPATTPLPGERGKNDVELGPRHARGQSTQHKSGLSLGSLSLMEPGQGQYDRVPTEPR